MPSTVTLVTASPRILAAVRRRVKQSEISTAFKPALDDVWGFLSRNPGLRADGHNVFLYHHSSGDPVTGMDVDFGVEVTRHFPPEGHLTCVETPAGRAVLAIHRGSYQNLSATHAAVQAWIKSSGERVGAWSCEIYGDWSDNESKLETTVVYGLG